MTSVSSPFPIARQACAWAWVGTAKAPSNHARVAVENPSSASALLTGSANPPSHAQTHPQTRRPPGASVKSTRPGPAPSILQSASTHRHSRPPARDCAPTPSAGTLSATPSTLIAAVDGVADRPTEPRPRRSRSAPGTAPLPSVQPPPIRVCPSFVRWRTIGAVLAAGAAHGLRRHAGRRRQSAGPHRSPPAPPPPSATRPPRSRRWRRPDAEAEPRAAARQARRAPGRAAERGHPPADADAAKHDGHRVQEPHPRLLARRHHRQRGLRQARVLPGEGV